MTISVGIVGVTGYAGQELLKILIRHRLVSVRYLAARQLQGPCSVGELLPAFRGLTSLRVHPFELKNAVKECNLLFLSLPHGVSMGFMPQLFLKEKIRVIDLSGDFRLRSKDQFLETYQLKHTAAPLLEEAVYGLPEYARRAIRSARLVANPGCYPTAVLLGLLPLAKAKLLKREGLIVDAKSGATGAGRSLKEELLFPEVNEDLRAYRVNVHQHIPEMEQELSVLCGLNVQMVFVPHLVPLNRGLYATIYAPLAKDLTDRQLRSLYTGAYRKELFIRILPKGNWPQVRSVTGTNYCEIGLRVERERRLAILVVAIDNLGKGAAGQAVQNMNLMFGLKETEGLLP